MVPSDIGRFEFRHKFHFGSTSYSRLQNNPSIYGALHVPTEPTQVLINYKPEYVSWCSATRTLPTLDAVDWAFAGARSGYEGGLGKLPESLKFV